MRAYVLFVRTLAPLALLAICSAAARADVSSGPRVAAQHVLSIESKTLWKRAADPALVGPLGHIDDICAELATTQRRFDFAQNDDESATCDHCTFTCRDGDILRLTTGLPDPIDELVLFRSSSRATEDDEIETNHTFEDDHVESFLNAAMRIGDEWYVAADLDGAIGTARAYEVSSLEVLSFPYEDAGAEHVVSLRYLASTSTSEAHTGSHESILVLGADFSEHKPVLFAPLLVSASQGSMSYGDDGTTEDTSRVRTVRIRGRELFRGEETRRETTDGKVRRKTRIRMLDRMRF